MGAQEVDRQVVLDKFIAEIPQHTLDDLSGKAAPSTVASLRSERCVSHWRASLLRLLGNSPSGTEFYKKVQARVGEARAIENRFAQQKHEERLRSSADNVLGKKDASPVNMAQMTCGLVQAQIIAGKEPDVPTALGLVVEVVKQVHQIIEREKT